MGSMKKDLIKKTYDILRAEGIQNIKIRRIATELGCTSTVIYKHFDDLDHLVTFASIWYLKDYIEDFKTIVKSDMNILDMNLKLWERFSYYAFQDIPLFELLFWGKYKESLGDMVFEYYHMFRDEMVGFDGLSASIIFNNDLREREYIMLRRAASTGCINYEDIEILSYVVTSLFHGFLLEYNNRNAAAEGVERFMQALTSVISKYRIDH